MKISRRFAAPFGSNVTGMGASLKRALPSAGWRRPPSALRKLKPPFSDGNGTKRRRIKRRPHSSEISSRSMIGAPPRAIACAARKIFSAASRSRLVPRGPRRELPDSLARPHVNGAPVETRNVAGIVSDGRSILRVRDHLRERRPGGRPGARPAPRLRENVIRTAFLPTRMHQALPHDSAHKHVTGEALYVDDLPEPAGTGASLFRPFRPDAREDRLARPRPGPRLPWRARRAHRRRHSWLERYELDRSP